MTLTRQRLEEIRNYRPSIAQDLPQIPRADAEFVSTLLGASEQVFVLAIKNYHSLLLFHNPTSEQIESHRDRLKKIAVHASALMKLLKSDIADGGLFPDNFDGCEVPDYGRYRRFVEDLDDLGEQADFLSKSDYHLRLDRAEDPTRDRQREKGPATVLWPDLFSAYQAAGHKLSLSPESRLHRLVKIAHAALELPEPAFSTLRDVRAEYKKRHGHFSNGGKGLLP
jgi:hypothetical protein